MHHNSNWCLGGSKNSYRHNLIETIHNFSIPLALFQDQKRFAQQPSHKLKNKELTNESDKIKSVTIKNLFKRN